jgi:hypothetical protein
MKPFMLCHKVAEFEAQKIDGGLWIARANNRVCMYCLPLFLIMGAMRLTISHEK